MQVVSWHGVLMNDLGFRLGRASPSIRMLGSKLTEQP